MNRLSRETSPYLLQHAENPVDWHPWGLEARELARAQQRPIFLSIGYSACHWCHVMAHESFEDPQIARLLNENFVSIKVDREERPDLDQIYMEAVQAMTGQGGWPLSAFLTPEQKPFYGGTYWPSQGRGNLPGFAEVLTAVAGAWRDRRDEVLRQADKMVRFLRTERSGGERPTEPSESPLEAAEAALSQTFDSRLGGFGPAPKFPHATDLHLLLRRWRHGNREDLLEMVVVTLDHMAAGGIQDQLGGGFHRYSVDAEWLVPHFEKMLYDNALLAGCYLEAWQATERNEYARIVRQTLDYVLRDMTDSPDKTGTGSEPVDAAAARKAGREVPVPILSGGFHSAEDADSEGEEGKFYLWTPGEVQSVLGPDRARTFCYVYDVTEPGNFEGRSILHLVKPIGVCAKILGRDLASLDAELADDRARLLAARSKRIRPGRDDKILTSWNALAIDSLARAGAAMDEPRYKAAAAGAAEFLLENLRDAQGRLVHSWRAGRASTVGFLDDYASLANALATLYETQRQRRWLDEAVRLADAAIRRFSDPRHGGFFYTPIDHEPLIARKKDLWDSPAPSSTGLMATALLRLARLADRDDYRRTAESAIVASIDWMQRAPLAAGQLLIALDMLLREFMQVPSPTGIGPG